MNIILLMLPILLIVLSGYISALCGFLPEESNDMFTRFIFFVAMPGQLFLDFSQTPISDTINLSYIGSFALSVLIIGGVTFLYARYFLKESLAESALSVMGAAQVNTAYFAIPLFILVFNNSAPVIPILIFQVTILTTIILLMIEHEIKKQKRKKYLLIDILVIAIKNPIIIASIIGLICSFFSIQAPEIINKFFTLLGSTAAPLALFALGQSLNYDLRRITKKNYIELFMLGLSKLIIHPLVAFIIGRYIFKLSHFWLASLIIMAAMPSPKNMFIFSVKYKLNTKKAASIVASTTLMSFVTLNLIMILFKKYLNVI
ncbi:MAG: AEC family transporter [Gammaproteobacteria bacterium]